MGRGLKVALTVLCAVAVGLLGLALVFVDVAPTETAVGRVATGAALFLVAGLAVGFANPEGRAWLLAGLAAWGLVLLGGMGLWLSITSPASGDAGLALLFLLGPLAAALLGGWLGARARRRRARGPAGSDPARA